MFGGQINGRIDHVFGKGGIRPQLVIRQIARAHGNSSLQVLNLSVVVRIALPNVHKNPESPILIGRAFPDEWHTAIGTGYDVSWDFALDVDDGFISRIEEYRQGNSLFVMLETKFIGAEIKQDGTLGPVECVTTAGTYGSMCHKLVEKSRWLEVLGELGYGEYVCAEIPLPRVRNQKLLDRPLARLKDAWQHFHDGKDREVLAACHDSLESLAKGMGYTKPDQSAYAGMFSSLPSEKRETLKMTFDYITSFMHLGRHEQKDTMEIDHRDAELALVLVQACLSYLSRVELRRNRKATSSS